MKKHKKNKQFFLFFLLGLIILGGVAYFTLFSNKKLSSDDEFALCLANKGAKMYGAWWCKHCQNQKNMFGSSWEIFEKNGGYVECSTRDGKQTEECKQAGIRGYPTWRFADNTELSGEVRFDQLEEKTGCQKINK